MRHIPYLERPIFYLVAYPPHLLLAVLSEHILPPMISVPFRIFQIFYASFMGFMVTMLVTSHVSRVRMSGRQRQLDTALWDV